MADSPPQLSVPLEQGQACGPGGLEFEVVLPVSRKLQKAGLRISAADAAPKPLGKPGVAVDSDAILGGSLDSKHEAHWLSLDWGEEKAIVSLSINAPALLPAYQTGVRVRMFSGGNWLPLPPRDTFSFTNGVAKAGFPAVAASRFMVELLKENQVAGNWSGVLVPGGVAIADASVSATPQPCHVSLAIGDDAPFFTRPGPLPATPVPVDGLSRALNRYLTDHPGATRVPLVLKAATQAGVTLSAFEAVQEAPPATTPAGTPAAEPEPPRVEKSLFPPSETPGVGAAPSRGRWCDARHSAAQGFDALPAGQCLSAVEVFLRGLGTLPASASLGIVADQQGQPGASTLVSVLAAGPIAPATDPDWLRFQVPRPLPRIQGKWWIVLQASAGELLWYMGEAAPAGVGCGLARLESSSWLPLDGAAGPWLQARVQIVTEPEPC